MKKQVELSQPFDLSKIDANKTKISFVASDQERGQIRETLGIDGLLTLSGDIEVKPWRKDGFMLVGKISAEVTQTCVVTLEPVNEQVEFEFEQTFQPGTETDQDIPELEVDFNLETEDPPDLLEGHTLDLLSIVSEHLALNLNPYPRKPDASIDEAYQESHEEEAAENPFAVLKQLKD